MELLERPPAPISVLGFGACLITGYPLPEEAGFFGMAVKRAAVELNRGIDHKIVTITSCTAPKAVTRLAEDVLPQRPDIVVFQFGQSDIKVAVKRLWREVTGQQRSPKEPVLVTEKPLRLNHRIDLFLRACAGLALGARPYTLRDDYRQSIAKMVETVVSAGIYPIVFTPFVFDNFLSDAWGRCYSRDLVDDFAGRDDVCVINGWEALAGHPRPRILLHDGMHLTRLGHQILADRLRMELVECIKLRRVQAPSAMNA